MKKYKTKNLEDRVYNYQTKHKEGFTKKELEKFVEKYATINMKKFNDAMMGNTCMIIDGEIVNYHRDVLTALRCGLENRDMHSYEFD